MLIDNIKFLKKNHIDIYQKLEDIEREGYKEIYLEKSKDGTETMKYIGEDKSIYVHSKYRPKEESESLVKDFFEAEGSSDHIIVYGIGLGYHIASLVEKYPNAKLSLVEPSIEILHAFLCEFNVTNIKLENIYLENEQYLSNLVEGILINTQNQENKIFILNSYKNIFKENHEKFLAEFNESIKNKRNQILTNFNFQKRWVINSMKNFSTTLNTKNILLQNRDFYKGKTALIVSAGPSLEEEIENIRTIVEKKLAFVFTAGSSISTLLKHGIHPHATTTYDPGEFNHNVFNKIYEKNITSIPVIYGTSVGYETIEKYPGEKLHMITSQDMISQFLVQSVSKKPIEGIIDSPSIAVIDLQLLYRLGFSSIILVGQNFAYRDNKRYSSGIEYEKETLDEELLKKAIKVKSVDGDTVYTNYGFNQMREQMEQFISVCKGANIINTTQGGAHINGTEFMSLQEVINNYLKEPTINEYWYDILETDSYDIDYLESRNYILKKGYDEIDEILKEINTLNEKIVSLARNQNFKQVEAMYNNIDVVFSKLWNNAFYEIALKYMHRVEYELLGKEVSRLRKENNSLKKADGMVNAIGKFVHRCYLDYNELSEAFEEVQEAIEKKISEKNFRDKEKTKGWI